MPYTNSVLRYPGGKNQLSKYVEHLLEINDISGTYVEPFAGGFGVALYLLFNGKVNNVMLNDYDPSIYSIWYSILNNKDMLIEKILNTDVNMSEWWHQKEIRIQNANNPESILNAFSTLFLNRTNVSGIINGGPIGGKKQSGKYRIDCRFNKKVLIEKIEKIHDYRNQIFISNKDASDFIDENLVNLDFNTSFIFFDPPYFKQGKNLYMSFVDEDKHAELSKKIINLEKFKWITTYDEVPEILKLYQSSVPTYEYELNYTANRKRKAKEYIFCSSSTKIDSYQNINLCKV